MCSPQREVNEFRKKLIKIDEQQTHITALESKVTTQQETIEQQQNQMKALTLKVQSQAAAIETLTTQIKMSSASAAAFTNR